VLRNVANLIPPYDGRPLSRRRRRSNMPSALKVRHSSCSDSAMRGVRFRRSLADPTCRFVEAIHWPMDSAAASAANARARPRSGPRYTERLEFEAINRVAQFAQLP